MTTAQVLQKNGRLVGTKHDDQLISRYKKERWVANTQFLGKPDSLSTWFDIEEITQFLRSASPFRPARHLELWSSPYSRGSVGTVQTEEEANQE